MGPTEQPDQTAPEDDNSRLIIDGTRTNSEKFRPSDWIERISSLIASFGPDQRLRYSKYVHPCVIADKKCLVVAKDLNVTDPAFFDFIIQFAADNQLLVQEDRRLTPRHVTDDRREEPQQTSKDIPATPLKSISGI